MRNITASQALQVILDKVDAEGIDSLETALAMTIASEKTAESAMLIADAISNRNDAVQDAQQLNGTTVVVQLGNYGDTSGAALAKGQVLTTTFSLMDDAVYLIATPVGIASATKVHGGGYYYSTHCMPVQEYADWILRSWDLDVDEHEEALNESELLGNYITDSKVMMNLIKEALESLKHEG